MLEFEVSANLIPMASRALYARSLDWADVGGRLDELLEGPGFRVIKKTSRTLAGIGRINGAEVFVKRVTSCSWSTGLAARICRSPARKTIGGASILEHAGFAHPQLIAAFEHYRGGSRRASYIIAEYLQRPKLLSRFALADGRDFRWRRWVSLQLAQTIRRLHDAGCYTRDLQETNLMVEAQERGLKVYFIDLEDFRWRPRVSRRLRLRNLVHLDRSIGRFVSRAHRLRFFYNYLGDKPDRTEVRALVRGLHLMDQRIERHQRRRQRSTSILLPQADRPQSKSIPAD
jgi:hypothetical protein